MMSEGLLMEESILMLDNRTDPATKQMLQNVVKKKKKFDNYKFFHNLSIVITLVLAAWFLSFLYQTIISYYSYSLIDIFTVILSSNINQLFLLSTIGAYLGMNILKKQREKFEKEYHGLRCEIVDRSKDLWKKEEEWKNRHVVFEMMKKKYDINLYHENK
jgi:hypothetical protein